MSRALDGEGLCCFFLDFLLTATQTGAVRMSIAFSYTTAHGSRRMQQRAISQEDIERLLRYGRPVHANQAVRYIFDKRARRRLARTEGQRALKGAENKLDIFAVFSHCCGLITAGYRTERTRR